MTVRISAIICTYNRASYLRKAIQSLVDQDLAKNEYEILVVDNCSSDDTKKVVTEEFNSAPNLKYIFEPQLGLSNARNTGWKAAKGAYIAYLDDDAIASSHWLSQLIQTFESTTPMPGCVGGKIDPIWEADRPQWLPDNLLPYLTILDWSDQTLVLDKAQYIAGANMAFSKTALELVNGFQSELGRKGKKLLSNEELVLQNQLRNHNLDIIYDPIAVVDHHVVLNRLKQKWFLERTYWQGVSRAYLLATEESPSASKRFRMSSITLLKLLKAPKQIAALLLPTNNPRMVEAKCRAANKVGYIVGLLTVEVSG